MLWFSSRTRQSR